MTNVIAELGAPLSPKQIYFTITEDISEIHARAEDIFGRSRR